MFSLLVLACMAHECGFLVMIYHWHGGLHRFTTNFPSLSISQIAMVLWVHLLLFSSWFSCSYAYDSGFCATFLGLQFRSVPKTP